MTDDIPCGDMLDQLAGYVNLGLKWGTKQFKSACPPNIKIPKKKCTKSEDIDPPCTGKPCKQIVKPCYIKMQDPYALPCCEPEKTHLSPCPPKDHLGQPRKLECICDLCKKERASKHKCCDN